MAAQPEGWKMDDTFFDPDLHLQIEPPTMVKDLNFQNVPFPYSTEEASKKRGFAYSAPFRVLSDEGVRAARAAVDNNVAAYNDIGKGNQRASFFVRGLGYTSRFMRDFTYDPSVTQLLSDIARDQLGVHTMTMSVGHTNVGQVATGRPVDKWHVDSTDYVLITIISDIEEMKGGLLRVLQQPDSSGRHFQELLLKGVPQELVETVKYTGPGYAIFMQGSKILHAVTPVLEAREPRYSLVNSYMTRDVFLRDPTKYHTFLSTGFDDRKDVVPLEYARHKAWRVKGQMKYILDEMAPGVTPEEIAKILETTSEELKTSALLIREQQQDNAAFVDDEKTDGRAEAKRGAGRKGGMQPVTVRSKL